MISSLDGSHMIQHNLREGELATVHSVLDHYIKRPFTPPFNDLTLFAKDYSMPSQPGTQLCFEEKCHSDCMSLPSTRPRQS